MSKPILINEWRGDFEKKRFYGYNNKKEISVSDDLFLPERVEDLREAAIVHKKVRKYAQDIIKPGVKIYDICTSIENRIVETFGKNDFSAGIGFPVGFAINSCAAHDSASPNDDRIVNKNDVIKIDFGTHVNGNIIDSAFTVAFNKKYTPLLQATYEATWGAIHLSGPDASIDDISGTIQEIIESYEIDIDKKTVPIHAIVNLGGHTIEPYKIHAGKLMLGGRFSPCNKRMESGECWAIETFATTSDSNFVKEDNSNVSLFSLKNDFNRVELKLNSSKKLLGHIQKTRKTLPLSSRWLDRDFGKAYGLGLKELVNKNIVTEHPPLVSGKNSYTSQFEHTIFLHDFGKEVLSAGDDY